MRALVTGGAGFIGSSVVRLLRRHGVEVRVLDNLSTGHRGNLDGLEAELVEGDIRDADLVATASRGVDCVFHLAARVGNVRSLENPLEDSAVNVLGTLNVLEAARKAPVKRVVYSSSAATFGEVGAGPVAEDHPQNPDSPYGVSKLAGEKHALCYGKVYGFPVVCLRYFNVYGVNQRYDAYGNVIPIFADRLAAGRPLVIYGDGEQTRDFVNVGDVAAANYLAATAAPGTGVYNVGSGSAVTINALAALVQEASGLAASVIRHEAPRAGEVRHCAADIRKAGRDLGFRPSTDLRAGLKEYVEWFKRNRGG